jgi:DNA repair exonuclease SbcCD ATPase subunit
METLDNLDVDYTPAWVAGKKGKSVLAENTGNSQTQRLQSLLKENRELKQQVKELNAKLSVGYAQGNEMQTNLNEALSQAKASEDKVDSLNEENKALKEDFKQLKEVQRRLAEQNRDAIADKKKLSDLSTKLNESLEVNKKLNGDINSIRENLEVAQRTIKTQKQTFVEQLNQKDARIATLEENIKNDGAIYKEGIVKAKNLVEKYKKMSSSAVNGYIRLKANMIGVPESQIKSRLGESYTFSDIDKICESLMPTIKQRNSLPFNSKVIGAKVTSQKIEDSTPQRQADVVDIFGYSEW